MRKSLSVTDLFYCVVALFFACALVVGIAKPFFKDDVYAVTISDKGERCKSRDSCKYLFYTDKGVFQNTDSWINLKWSSADFYNDVKVGKTYDLRVSGWRVPFLNWFPNVVEYKEVK